MSPKREGVPFNPENYDRRFWQVGVCGNANIVTYDGEDVHGVAWVSDPHTIVKAHNDLMRKAIAPSEALAEMRRRVGELADEMTDGGYVDPWAAKLRTILAADGEGTP